VENDVQYIRCIDTELQLLVSYSGSCCGWHCVHTPQSSSRSRCPHFCFLHLCLSAGPAETSHQTQLCSVPRLLACLLVAPLLRSSHPPHCPKSAAQQTAAVSLAQARPEGENHCEQRAHLVGVFACDRARQAHLPSSVARQPLLECADSGDACPAGWRWAYHVSLCRRFNQTRLRKKAAIRGFCHQG